MWSFFIAIISIFLYIVFHCCRRKVYDYEQIVVTPIHPGVETCSAQLNEENEDFSGRRRYHQTATVTGQYVNVD